jgi:nucleotide-binding universal stress UspA family protein
MVLFNTNRVLVPIDFSQSSFEAVENTLEWIHDPTHLHLIHVLPHISSTEPGILWKTVDNPIRQDNAHKSLKKRLSGSQYEGIEIKIMVGEPAAEIIDYANLAEMDLIVIPSHARKGLNRFFMGSVTERVVRFAHCPVLVLRIKESKLKSS